ncbi:hypothetical protein JK635_02105 [Neobacillus sp. YIM B02564]|uniref:Uncharacterized protein n=1 Tax=Neobacillus paridis TaxID=2803862 RepID=A0ABS1TID9_9BACI|nr:hypothetical protein [Neobacillus paridis]MBL4951032.1 hypothetical protein [Neobacillus paridis]
MKSKYKVTYSSATNPSQTYVDSYEMFELALERYDKVIEQFDTFADVKLIVETVIMYKA